MKERVAIGTDHGGFEDKNRLVKWLADKGYEPIDCGSYTPDMTDYPIYAGRVAQAVSAGMAHLGVIICKAGNGMSITANRFPGVRAGIGSDPDVARLSREHNDANVLVMGAEHMGHSSAEEILEAWLAAKFDTGGRHERRVDLIKNLDDMLSSSIPTHKMVMAGQAPWLDDLSEELISSGQLEEYAMEYGVRGVTSNPTIFDKSIAGDKGNYPERLKKLKKEKASAQEAYDKITVDDVASACDVMRPVFDATGGDDGRVSYEVEPKHSRDEEKTVSEAQRIAKAIGRPNVFIKIPATPEGLGAIRRSIAAGVSINVTLMFSTMHYEDVARAYIAGLRDRHAAGKPVHDVRSVASVFISRIDAAVNKKLDAILQGKHTAETRQQVEFVQNRVAIANARRCYRIFQDIFLGEEFEDLLALGATPQRPLWASTGVKDKNLPEQYYVERMVAPYTVNTMPEKALKALLATGRVRPNSLFENEERGEEVLKVLAKLGVDLDAICAQLQDDGLKSFADSFESLYSTLEEKLK